MPYERVGRRIYKIVGGKRKLKQTCRDEAAAKKALRLLRAVERGWKPTGKKRRE